MCADVLSLFLAQLCTARGIRNLLELLGVRICEATDKTGDDNGVQRATHRLLYGPRVSKEV